MQGAGARGPAVEAETTQRPRANTNGNPENLFGSGITQFYGV